MDYSRCRNKDDFFLCYESDIFKTRRLLEGYLAESRAKVDSYSLPGFCLVDGEAVDFHVDKLYGSEAPGGYVIPNWRERLLCPKCGLNNRQRAIVGFAKEVVKELNAANGGTDLYVMEQVTPLFRALNKYLPQTRITGSEYLNPSYQGGRQYGGVRHENVEVLSFPDHSFDVVMSNDVLEHVNDPRKACEEIFRILRPGGKLLLSVPFDVHKSSNTTRAKTRDGEIFHFLPPEYHGNPLSNEGSLVFTDFGWEFFSQLQETGLKNCSLMLYWSLEYGHLGGCQFFICGEK